MNTIVLLHGAWHGPWCWDYIVPRLSKNRIKALAPTINWEQDYVDELCSVLTSEPGKHVLVGHSFGGMVASRLAESIPEKISAVVYLSGFLLKDGQCIRDTELLMQDSYVQSRLVLTRDKQYLSIDANSAIKGFYHDCNRDDFEPCLSRIRPQPVSSFIAPVRVTRRNFGKLPIFYIECTLDRAIPVSAQRTMYADWKCESIFTLDSSHSPFFSMPDKLADILNKI